jgi:hypothetical protein
MIQPDMRGREVGGDIEEVQYLVRNLDFFFPIEAKS